MRVLSGLAAASLVTLTMAGFTPAASATVQHSSHSGGASHTAAKPVPPAHGVTGTYPSRHACARPAKAGFASCFSIVRTNMAHHRGLYRHHTTPAGYGPADLQSAYNLPSATAGGGATVGIVDAFDNPGAEADLTVYRAQFGLPPCTTANGCFAKVNQEGKQGDYPPVDPTQGWELEESLDVDMVSAICPNCHIILVEADDNSTDNLGAGVNEAVKLGADYVSNSYGGAEDPSDKTLDTQFFQHPGVAVTASSGDFGFGPQYPAASQYVTAVGGTTLTQDSSAPRGWSETAWSGAGSGCSSVDAKPSWQTDKGCAKRTETDVSADADPNTGAAVYDTDGFGGWTVVGGTSEASPIIASTYALAGTPVAGTYPASYLYADTSALNDVTSGSNGSCHPAYLCTARPGYDGPTGWGTPDGVAAFTTGPHGVVSGTVAGPSGPLSGAEVDVGTDSTRTSTSGAYSITVPVGTYSVSAKDFGFLTKTVTGVAVTNHGTTTENFALKTAPSVTLTGTVTDGSGQGWPLFANVSVPGSPASAYTNPATGQYRLTLPANATYTVQVDSAYPGYQQAQASVTVHKASLARNFSVKVAGSSCTAPGYKRAGGKCAPLAGGLVEGNVYDGNTGAGVNNATVTSVSNPKVTATTMPSPNDPNLADGFYFLFSPKTGSQRFTAAAANYSAVTGAVTVVSKWVATGNFTLPAGQLTVTPASLSATQRMGQSKAEPLKFSNTGTEPVNVKLLEQPGTFKLFGPTSSTPVHRVNGRFSPLSAVAAHAAKQRPPGGGVVPADAPWANLANYPATIMDNAAATDTVSGDVYSVGGFDGLQTDNSAYVYSPATQSWTALPPMQNAREAPQAAFIGGKLYVTGGWGSDGNPVAALEIYDPATGTWSTGASLPTPLAGASVATENGDMYVIGGCDAFNCGYNTVQIYDPASNSWSSGAAYPETISWESCGAIEASIYCAGGSSGDTDTSDSYVYSPATNTWASIAPLPIDLWASGYVAANQQLLVSGGVTNGFNTVTNQGYAYDPSSNSWTALPNSNNTDYRAGSACGFYRVGGSTTGFTPQDFVEQLPGFSTCGITNVPWLSESRASFTVPPGQSVTVEVTMNAASKSVTQPGTYTGSLAVAQNTPYPVTPVDVTMLAKPPVSWGEIGGKVTGLGCHAPSSTLAGATVQINTWAASYTLKTGTDGSYALWLDVRNNPLQLIVAKDGWQPQTRTARIARLTKTKENFVLKNASC